jgi:hypothetical protein
MHRFHRSKNTRWATAMINRDEGVERLRRRPDIPCVDLSSVDKRYRYPSYGKHWTPEGNRLVAELLARSIQNTTSLAFDLKNS